MYGLTRHGCIQDETQEANSRGVKAKQPFSLTVCLAAFGGSYAPGIGIGRLYKVIRI